MALQIFKPPKIFNLLSYFIIFPTYSIFHLATKYTLASIENEFKGPSEMSSFSIGKLSCRLNQLVGGRSDSGCSLLSKRAN